MKTFTMTTQKTKETKDLAKNLAQLLKPNAIVCLFGDLGTGKTTFVKGMAKGLRIAENKVQSPTFVLMNIYDGKLRVHHFDLYRLESKEEINRIGLNDYLYDDGVSVIEWADRLEKDLPKDFIRIDLKHKNEHERKISIKGEGKASQVYVEALRKKYL